MSSWGETTRDERAFSLITLLKRVLCRLRFLHNLHARVLASRNHLLAHRCGAKLLQFRNRIHLVNSYCRVVSKLITLLFFSSYPKVAYLYLCGQVLGYIHSRIINFYKLAYFMTFFSQSGAKSFLLKCIFIH
jgi:hypothetical protein